MFKVILKVVFIAIIIAMIFTVGYQLVFGDVGNYWWILMIIGVAAGAFAGFKIKDKYIGRTLGITLLGFFLFLALLMIVYGAYGLIFDRDLITGQKYMEMGGMLPYLAIAASLFPMFLAFTVKLYLKKLHF